MGKLCIKYDASVCLFCISLGGDDCCLTSVSSGKVCVWQAHQSWQVGAIAFCREVSSSSTGQTRELFQSLRPANSLPWLLTAPLSFLRLQPTIPLLPHPSSSCSGYFLELFNGLLWSWPLAQWLPLRRQLVLPFTAVVSPWPCNSAWGIAVNADGCLAVFAAWPANHSMLPLHRIFGCSCRLLWYHCLAIETLVFL